MVRTNVVGLRLVVLSCVLLLSPPAWAQSPSGIAGVVKDTSGAVLPGVTVEAASPALIEKVRTVVTDGEGRYNIVDLRPGAYLVTFTLAGFSVVRREGIELSSGFTAAVNVSMQVGSLEETITVTGASPLVDTQNVRQQKVMSNELLASLPTGQMSLSTLVALTPGMAGQADVGGAQGTWTGQQQNAVKYHGKTASKVQFDGMRIQNFSSGGSPGYMFNVHVVEEMTVETGGLSAETSASGMTMNLIPKEGSNTFKFGASGLYTNDHLQSDNLTDELRTRGLTTVNKVLNMYDVGVTVAGPLKKDRLWFFGVYRRWGSRNQIAGGFWNKTQGTPFYTPDLARPESRYEWFRSHAARVTWQLSPRNKVNVFTDLQRDCLCVYTFEGVAPESSVITNLWPTGIIQGTWSAPLTSKLLLEAGAAAVLFHFPAYPQPGVEPNHISILEQSTNFRYNAPAFGFRRHPNVTDRYVQRFAVSYVTGSHAFKAGLQNDQGILEANRELSTAPHAISYLFLRGVPVGVTQYALPYREKVIGKAEVGIYAQDQWAVKRLTLNYGLRFDYLNGYVPEHHLAPGPFAPARDFAAVHKVPEWKDFMPRLGASYDLFGNGRTALKVSLGRYGELTGSQLTQANNPVVTSVNQVDRPWTDANRNYVPDCDLTNFAANGECGLIADLNFGKNNPSATRYADDVLRGWGVRSYFWDFGTEVQHQLGRGISVTGGYYRNWSGNYRVTDNLAVRPEDYSPYCITAPVNAQLPGGGGYPICGLYDISPAKFGQISNLVTQASHFVGTRTQVTCGSQNPAGYVACGTSNFFAVSLDGRFASGIRLGGGVDTGRTVTDSCFVVDSSQQLLNCHVVTSWLSNLQVKLNGSYPLPAGFIVSGTFQNVAGLAYTADYPATTAEIAPSLGRNLAGGRRTATVPLIAPQTQFEDRRTQLDLRLTKKFKLGEKASLQGNFDVYNALNANTILTVNNTFGAQWRRPILILDGRLVQFSGQLSF